MEDASNEFRVFMSPKNDYKESFRKPSVTKQRMVPVISKFLATSPSFLQAFNITQKKISVYKAVSGVSFQSTNQETPQSRAKSDRGRRKSLAQPAPLPKDSTELLLGAGARRSKSLTSIESEYSNSSGIKKREIIYPCTPIILSNVRGRKRSISDRKTRRSLSQVHNIRSDPINANNLEKKDIQPTCPRRTRSTSRSRKSSNLSALSDVKLQANSSVSSSDKVVQSKVKFRKQSKGDSHRRSSLNSNLLSEEVERKELHTLKEVSNNNEDVDFNVNENDWQKYDVLVSRQLDNILRGKGKEEPEGGYFSLEREEGEDTEKISVGGDYFQKDNSNESIYVAQSFASNKSTTTSQGAITMEEIYREVLFDSPSQEVGFVDDEGLYEEIFFERKLSPLTQEKHIQTDSYIVTSPINIVIPPQRQELPPLTPQRSKRFKKRTPVSTVVHIGGIETDNVVSTVNCPTSNEIILPSADVHKQTDNSACIDQSFWCTNVGDMPAFRPLSYKNFQTSFTSIQSESNATTPCHISERCQENTSNISLNNHHLSIHENSDDELANQRNVKEKAAFFQRLSSNSKSRNDANAKPKTGKSTCSVDRKECSRYFSSYPKRILDNELNQERKAKSEPHLIRSSIDNIILDGYLAGVEYNSNTVCISCPLKIDGSKSAASSPSFQRFLQNSLFNPDTESLTDEVEELTIDPGQTVTCITDSSDEEESESEANDSISSNLWLEAKNDFEFVTFKEQLNKISKERENKKFVTKAPCIPKSIYSGLQSSNCPVVKTSLIESDFREVPERPSRRRERTNNNFYR